MLCLILTFTGIIAGTSHLLPGGPSTLLAFPPAPHNVTSLKSLKTFPVPLG